MNSCISYVRLTTILLFNMSFVIEMVFDPLQDFFCWFCLFARPHKRPPVCWISTHDYAIHFRVMTYSLFLLFSFFSNFYLIIYLIFHWSGNHAQFRWVCHKINRLVAATIFAFTFNVQFYCLLSLSKLK